MFCQSVRLFVCLSVCRPLWVCVIHTKTHADTPEAVLGGCQGAIHPGPWPLWELCSPFAPPPNETGCKVARLHNTCIYSVASHSWCLITPFTKSCIMSSGILAPPQKKIQIWPPRWQPQTAAARNAPGSGQSPGPKINNFGIFRAQKKAYWYQERRFSLCSLLNRINVEIPSNKVPSDTLCVSVPTDKNYMLQTYNI